MYQSLSIMMVAEPLSAGLIIRSVRVMRLWSASCSSIVRFEGILYGVMFLISSSTALIKASSAISVL